MANININNNSNLVRVNFTNRGLARVLNDGSSISPNTPDKSTIMNLAKVLSDVKINRGQPTTFASIPEFLGVDYVGYIIEKERLNKVTGEWERIDEYRIIGTAANSFIDTRIAYGNSYRYRMKSIAKVTKSKITKAIQDASSSESIQVSEQNTITDSLIKNQDILANLSSPVPGLTSKVSTGISSTEISLNDNSSLRITPSSTDLVIQPITSNENLRVLDNLKVSDISLTRGDTPDRDLQALINVNLQNLDETQVSYESSYYESNPSRGWLYVDVVDLTPPPAPQTIKIIPDSVKKQIFISWLKPVNPQLDIQFFKIYRREKLGDTWVLLSELREIDVNADGLISDHEQDDADKSLIPASTNLFIDKNVEFGKKYIYALTCIDVHGTESFLSAQVQAELNSNFIVEKREKPLKWISGGGAKLSETHYVVKKFLDRNENLIAKKSIFIAPTTKFAETEKNLIIRIKSLDTHIKHEIKVTLLNTNITETPT